MAKGMYIGVDGKARKGKKAYIGVDGKARKIKKIYIGVDNKARLLFSGQMSSVSYYGTIDSLSENSYLAGKYVAPSVGEIGNYAVFSGGFQYERVHYSANGYPQRAYTDYYNSSLTKGSTSDFYAPTEGTGVANTESYLLFAGGDKVSYSEYYGSSMKYPDDQFSVIAINSSMTANTSASLGASMHFKTNTLTNNSDCCNSKGGCRIGNYAVFPGGYCSVSTGPTSGYSTPYTDIRYFDNSLTRSIKSSAISSITSNGLVITNGAASNSYCIVRQYNYSTTIGVINSSLTFSTFSGSLHTDTPSGYVINGKSVASVGDIILQYDAFRTSDNSYFKTSMKSINSSLTITTCSNPPSSSRFGCLTISTHPDMTGFFGGTRYDSSTIYTIIYNSSLTKQEIAACSFPYNYGGAAYAGKYLIVGGGANSSGNDSYTAVHAFEMS